MLMISLTCARSGLPGTFTSRATNLVEAELPPRPYFFEHDRETGETTHVSVASDGTRVFLA
jgi:hypothetical protein